ncbi:MAG: hypothetical protein AAF871_02955 [Pseudomonadota bacterium]
MKRRTVLGAGLGGLALSATAVSAQSRIPLSIVTDMPERAEGLARRVSAASAGRIAISVREAPASDAPGFLDAAGSGRVDGFVAYEDAFIADNPAYALFSAMPGGMSPSECEGWCEVADGTFFRDILGEEHGVKTFAFGDDGPMPLWSKEPLRGLSSLTSARIGTRGMGLQAYREMGAGSVEDITQARARDLRRFDLIEGMSYSEMAERELLGVFTHAVAPNAIRPMSTRAFGINLAKWQGMSPEDQTLLERCVTAEHGAIRAKAKHDNALTMRQVDGQVSSDAMPDDIWNAQIAAANALMGKMFDAGNTAADAADAYLYFLADVAGWSEIGEVAYFNGRKEVLSQ